MKRSILIFTLSLFFSLSTLIAQEWQVMPEQPQAGEKMTIHYNPTGGELEGTDVYAIAYVLQYEKMPDAHDVEMSVSDNGLTGHFQVPADAQAIMVKFTNEDGSKKDNNNDEAYHTMVFKNGKPVKNAYAASSSAYGSYARTVGIKSNAGKVENYFEMEMKANNADRMSLDYLGQYAYIASVTKNKELKESLLSHVEKASANAKKDEKDMTKLAGIARSLGDKELNKTITETVKEKFPEGKSATYAKFTAFRKIKELDAQIAEFKSLKAKYGDNEDYKSSLENCARTIANAYAKERDFENMEKYVAMISNGSTVSGIYNSLAWSLSGESIEGEGSHLEHAQMISKKSLKLTKQEMHTGANKPSYYSKREWKNNMNYSFGNSADTYALLSYKLGETKKAVKYQAIACKANKYKNAELNERHAIYLEKDQGAKASMKFLEMTIEEGHASSAMKEHFQKLFKANVSLDDASSMYLAKLEAKAKAKHVAEIKEKMINKEAPNFALTNLKGEEVSLESLKGKVVIVDFWATWCGPCKASFPGMQKAVTKYDSADDVEFVFVDTWESAKNKEENAQKFIDSKGYTFNVLMDNKNKMVVDYEVSGIPTKFILDKEGNIRFRSSGFGGNDEALVDEISIVVEILRGGGDGSGATGARP